MKHQTDDARQDRVAKFEINGEAHLTQAGFGIFKPPFRMQVFEGAVQIIGQDPALIGIQGDARSEFLAEHLEGNHKIRLHHLASVDRF